MKKAPQNEKFERCILCGALTDVPISMPVNMRENYEVGVGQICNNCAGFSQDAEIKKTVPTMQQIIIAVEQSRED